MFSLKSTGLANWFGLWETEDMKKAELTDMVWLGPRDEMDRASHLFGKCSQCGENICVEKAKADRQQTRQETSEELNELFRTHVKLKDSEDFSQAV